MASAVEARWQERQESNLQPPVLETGALPIELLSCAISTARPGRGKAARSIHAGVRLSTARGVPKLSRGATSRDGGCAPRPRTWPRSWSGAVDRERELRPAEARLADERVVRVEQRLDHAPVVVVVGRDVEPAVTERASEPSRPRWRSGGSAACGGASSATGPGRRRSRPRRSDPGIARRTTSPASARTKRTLSRLRALGARLDEPQVLVRPLDAEVQHLGPRRRDREQEAPLADPDLDLDAPVAAEHAAPIERRRRPPPDRA